MSVSAKVRQEEENKVSKKSKSGKTVKNPTGTASYRRKSGQMDQASRKAVKGAERKVLKSAAKAVARKVPVAAAAVALAEDRGVENFKSLKELERGKMSKGLRKVKPLPADKPKSKSSSVPRPKSKPTSPRQPNLEKIRESLRIPNDGGTSRTRVF